MARRDPETNPAAFLGAELRRARMSAGFSSQDALATRLGFDRTVVAKAETGSGPRRSRFWPPGVRHASLMRNCSGAWPRWRGVPTARCRRGLRTGWKLSVRRTRSGCGRRC